MLPERLRCAHRALLSLDEFDSDEEWLKATAVALAPIGLTDQVYYTGPGLSDDKSRPRFLVTGAGVDTAFTSRIRSDFKGYAANGDSEFAEEYSTFLHQMLRQNGPAMVHDEPLFDERLRKEMVLHAEAFDGAGILRQLALSVPRTSGESLMIFGYAKGSQPSPESQAFEALQQLLPSWERALRLRQARTSQAHWQVGIDLLPIAIIVVGEYGIAYANRAFEALLISEETRARLANAASAISRRILRQFKEDELLARYGYEHAVACLEGPFRLLARLDPFAESPVVLVSVEQPNALPPHSFLASNYALSVREIEALSLMVGGKSDKDIAFQMSISFHTARQYASAVLRKTAAGRSQLHRSIWSAFLKT